MRCLLSRAQLEALVEKHAAELRDKVESMNADTGSGPHRGRSLLFLSPDEEKSLDGQPASWVVGMMQDVISKRDAQHRYTITFSAAGHG